MFLFFLIFLFSFVTANENYNDKNVTELCSNGVKPGNSCHLVPSSGYECANSNSSTSWCESFDGKYKCCEKSITKCKDRSSFCRLTKHLCTSKSDFKTMKSKCEATCGFCGLRTFEEAEKTRQRMDELARGQECDLPRKCVFPKEKMLNSTSTAGNSTATPLKFQSINTNSSFTGNATAASNQNSTESTNPSTIIDLKAILQSTGRTSPQTTTSRPRSRSPRSSESRHNETTSITLPSSFNSTVRKLTLKELMTTRDTMPKITTAEPSSLTTSLSKTVIQGTCFDEYTYCREFTSLCSHPAFSEVMASHCSLTCGRCDEVERVEEGTEDCEDMTPDCRNYRDLCEHSRYKTLMENYCPKACGHCIPMCRDRHQNCPQFHEDGFCNDTMYTFDERKYLCGATCLFC
ncbi:ShKT domain-containing protein [Caenorhabditis elegans]|uniref:ShKT domain-containing protein n=1 Tax=Caenorhabditis elegans TaxID=6239 RepID=Q9XWZ0_CAEEL|nr:ShKT domain-containing protein [Caenorhabditis elegans]CAA21492.2 ShKT domain-containing protein [Caenorhabditis elegans]|eukprot:NP_499332.2 Uncharacterized protein CELE_Y45F3A.8 [Caenorhabditis elegans]